MLEDEILTREDLNSFLKNCTQSDDSKEIDFDQFFALTEFLGRCIRTNLEKEMENQRNTQTTVLPSEEEINSPLFKIETHKQFDELSNKVISCRERSFSSFFCWSRI
jgi:cell division FtsZ-interacting protein ZapD